MVLRVSEALDLPLRERNRLLAAAGWGAAYREADLDAAELAPFRAAIDRMLGAHEPYPAMVVDGHWTVVAANSACSALFGADVVGANMVQRYYSDAETRRAIVNWSEVARAASPGCVSSNVTLPSMKSSGPSWNWPRLPWTLDRQTRRWSLTWWSVRTSEPVTG